MLSTQIPTKFPIPFGNNAAAGTIRPIPQASQTASSPGQASLFDGFPVATGQPLASGGVPPAMQDFNGLLNQISAWSRWQAAAGLAPYDATFSTAIGGYPAGATILSSTKLGRVWISTAENNVTNPDGVNAANWLPLMLQSDVLPYTPAGSRRTSAFTANVVLSDMPNASTDYVAQQTPSFTGANYAKITGSCSIANTNSNLVNLYVKAKLVRTSDNVVVWTSQFLGGVGGNSYALPFSISPPAYQSLDPTQTYVAQLVTSKIGNFGPTVVNDGYILAETN